MTSKQRFRNKYQLLLRERDHAPAHVHLFGGGVDISIDLETLECRGEWPRGLKNEVLDWVDAHRAELIEEWIKWNK